MTHEMMNNIGYGVIITIWLYVSLYWILWFFKIPLYQKFSIHDNEEPQIICSIWCILGTFMCLLQYANDSANRDSLAFWFSVVFGSLVFIKYLPRNIVKLRSKIPNRWGVDE